MGACGGDDSTSSSSSHSILRDHIAAGGDHTCVILSGGPVKCWGDNSAGQTGGGVQNANNTLTLRGTASKPLSVGEVATHIEAGWNHACAILIDKSVKCWGENLYGATGGGTQNEQNTLALSGIAGKPLNIGETATAIAVGDGEAGFAGYTCVILSDKSVKCWGYGSGTGGGTENNSNVLSGTEGNPLNNEEKATHIAAGSYHTCVIMADKSVKCWGANDYGQTGGGTQNEQNTLALSGVAGKPLNIKLTPKK